MISQTTARSIALKNLPGWKIEKMIEYKGLYIFVMLDDGPEGGYDPFYSVDMKTGKFEGYAYLRDPKEMDEVDALLAKA